MVERDGLKPSNKDYAFNTSGRNNSGEETEDRKKQNSTGMSPFTPELAKKINNEFMGKLPDNTKLDGMYKDVKGIGKRPYGKWHEYLQGLELRERTVASAAVLPFF